MCVDMYIKITGADGTSNEKESNNIKPLRMSIANFVGR